MPSSVHCASRRARQTGVALGFAICAVLMIDVFAGEKRRGLTPTVTLLALVLTAALLRTIVYFRDNYRATNFGVPDLVQIIRAIDGEMVKLRAALTPFAIALGP